MQLSLVTIWRAQISSRKVIASTSDKTRHSGR